jgi:hypothetical protein
VRATVTSDVKKLKNGEPRTYFHIRIGWREYDKLVPRIEKYVIPEMKHKLGSLRDNGQLEKFKLKTRSELPGDRQSQLEITDRPPSVAVGQ